jgi:hypothetical protein
VADVRSYFVPFDLDSGGGTEYVIGVNLRLTASGGSIEALGQKAMASSIPVTMASDQSAIVVDSELPAAAALTDNFANPTAPAVGAFGMLWDGATWDRFPGTSADGATVNLGANNDVTVTSGAITADTELPAAAALADNTANPTVPGVGAFGLVWDGATWDRTPGNSADGSLVNLGTNNDVTVTSGTIDVLGTTASDAALTSDPVTIGGRASTATPTAVSTDGDVVNLWLDLRGAAKTVMVDDAGDSAMDGANNALRVNVVAGSGGGVTHTDDAAFTAAVDDGVPMFAKFDNAAIDSVDEDDAGILRMSANRNLFINIRDNAGNERGATVNASNQLDVAVGNTVTVDSELPAAAALADATANPTVPGVGGFLMGFNGTTWDRVRTANTGRLQVDVVTGGGSDTPTNPVTNTQTSTAVAAGATANVDSAEAASKKLAWIDVWSSVAWKGEIFTVDNGSESTRKGITGGPPMEATFWKPSHRNYITLGATAGTDAFRLKFTNLDDTNAADAHVIFHYED